MTGHDRAEGRVITGRIGHDRTGQVRTVGSVIAVERKVVAGAGQREEKGRS